MTRDIFVHLLPVLFQPDDLRDGTAVVIDVLRASTTITHALAAGANAVIPCEEVEEARQIAANLPATEVVLGGERDSKKIEGFDLDNSPLQYTPETVGGKTVVFTTTNGTRALSRSRQAERILLGSFVNLNAVIESLAEDNRALHLVCAGTRGQISAEDVLCAGAIAEGLATTLGSTSRRHDQTRIAMDFFAANMQDESSLLESLRESLGGRNLHRLGFDADIERAATRDLFDLVPRYSPQTGRIEVERQRTIKPNM
ncbi:MAG: 2-phosphosulfolactate phosphatase [Planctomycetes bacterium]|nr:2-phosphosulfolactate phosphatase [Planctomycetota bacterium]